MSAQPAHVLQLTPAMSIYDAVGIAMKKLRLLEDYLENKECTYLAFDVAPANHDTVLLRHDGVGRFTYKNASHPWGYEARVIPAETFFVWVDHLADKHRWTRQDVPRYLRLYTRQQPVSIG